MDQHVKLPHSVVLDDDGAVAEAHETAAGCFLLRSHNLFIKVLSPMILVKFATQRQAAELISSSEDLSLLPQPSSGSTVELLICVTTMLHSAVLSALVELCRTAAASSSGNTSCVRGHWNVFLTKLVEY